MAAPEADGAVPKDVMAYLAASNVSVYDHLSQVLAKVAVTSPKDAAANFDKISRGVLEDTFVWPIEAQPIKEDMTAQTASRDLFKVALPDPDVETAIVGPGAAKAADTYVPDIMAEAEMLQWSGASLGEVEMCKIMLAVRKLAGEHPELKSVRFFGKFLGTGSDYLVCEGELTDLDEAAPKDLPPNHPGRRNIEKVEHHNMLKYYVCSYPGAPWLALPNLRFDQLQAVGSVRKLLTGNPAAPIRSFPPFPGETEASYLRAKIAYIGMHTCMSPAGYFKELPADPDAQPARLRPSVAASGDWAAPEDPAALLAMGAWTMHYPGVPQPDAFPDDFGPDEEGNWPAVDPEPYTLRPNEEEPALWSARPCAALYRKFAPVALHSRVFPGAVVVAHQKAFCCFYHGWGNREDGLAFTPQMGPGLVMPRVCADDVYKVHIPDTVEKDEEGNVVNTIPPEVPPPYPEEGWKYYNDEQMDLRDKMELEWKALKEKEEEERLAAEAAAKEAAEAEAAEGGE